MRTPLKGHVPYTESAGNAKVQPTLKTLEALMRQLQSAMAHLKKVDQSSDSQQIKAYHASVDIPDTEYALLADDGHTLSSDNDIVHGSGWALPPPRVHVLTRPTTSAAMMTRTSPAILAQDPQGSGGGLSSYVKILDPLRDQEGCLELSDEIPRRC